MNVPRSVARRPVVAGAIVAAALAGGCGGGAGGVDPAVGELTCSINASEIFNGGPGKDGIPALTNPPTAGVGGSDTDYLSDGDRVVGLALDGAYLAVPLGILWWHEIVNLDMGGETLAVTHCPLTGSSIAFDRGPQGGVEFGVSGLLYRNNLIMYDRSSDESLWPQMARGARCGSRSGTDLLMVPVMEMTWGGWRTLHPDTRVVTSRTGFGRDYRIYPYGDYDRIDNTALLFPMGNLDPRRPPKERILGIPSGDGGVAYPFGELARLGPVGAVEASENVVFWDGERVAAMAYNRTVDGRRLDFHAVAGEIVDVQTGSTWQVDGLAVAGPLAGSRLGAVSEAYVAYWFAWAAFQPAAALWGAP